MLIPRSLSRHIANHSQGPLDFLCCGSVLCRWTLLTFCDDGFKSETPLKRQYQVALPEDISFIPPTCLTVCIGGGALEGPSILATVLSFPPQICPFTFLFCKTWLSAPGFLLACFAQLQPGDGHLARVNVCRNSCLVCPSAQRLLAGIAYFSLYSWATLLTS